MIDIKIMLVKILNPIPKNKPILINPRAKIIISGIGKRIHQPDLLISCNLLTLTDKVGTITIKENKAESASLIKNKINSVNDTKIIQ